MYTWQIPFVTSTLTNVNYIIIILLPESLVKLICINFHVPCGLKILNRLFKVQTIYVFVLK